MIDRPGNWNTHLVGNDDIRQQVDLDSADRPLPRDIFRKRLTGHSKNDKIPGNFIDCILEDVVFNSTHFDTSDFTDCVIQRCRFESCTLEQGSITGCAFIDCEFSDSKIELYALHDCIFIDCQFHRIYFWNSLIRHSTATRCDFVQCKVSNKVFDESLLTDVKFVDTPLDFRAVIDNFGLSSDGVPPANIRRDRSEASSPQPGEFENILSEFEESPNTLNDLERFKLQYYLLSSLDFSGEIFERVFEKDAWYKIALTPTSFVRNLDHFAEFILHAFDADVVELLGIARLHDLSSAIYTDIRQHPRYGAIAQSAVGIHIRTGDVLNAYCRHVDRISDDLRSGAVSGFRTRDGVLEKDVYEVLEDLSEHGLLLSGRVVHRNSPLDVIVDPVVGETTILAALFVATKFKLQLSQLLASDETEAGTVLTATTGEAHLEQ